MVITAGTYEKKNEIEEQSPLTGFTSDDEVKSVKNLIPVVGVGASAGGTEAICSFLENLEVNLGMAYVIILHLAPGQENMLTEIFAQKTSMPVKRIEDNLVILPNTVYVVPAYKNIGITASCLKLYEISVTEKPSVTIDYFFLNLASVYQSKAIGIILSGAGDDGTIGLKAIKTYGGITFAQNESAQFRGMPTSAGNSGFVDHILPPEKIAGELAMLVNNAFGTEFLKDESTEHKEDIKRILSIVYNRHGVDFTSYKQSTIHRRIMRRMLLCRFRYLKEYAQLLEEKPVEIDTLFNDLLINVTDFFRDPVTYQALVKKFSQLL